MEDIEKDMKPRFIEDLGMRYPTEKSSRKYRYGLYECQYCNKEFEASSRNIQNGHTKSCGCLYDGHPTHGLKSNRFYNTWAGMIHRCTNPKFPSFKNYGGRGITVCEEWGDVTNFVAWCEVTHPNIEGVSLDRIDNDKGYSPENCRWADRTTQSINQRKYKNNTSGYVGVKYNKKSSRWEAQVSVFGERAYLGQFSTIEEAVLARDNYIIENKLPHKLSTEY